MREISSVAMKKDAQDEVMENATATVTARKGMEMTAAKGGGAGWSSGIRSIKGLPIHFLGWFACCRIDTGPSSLYGNLEYLVDSPNLATNERS